MATARRRRLTATGRRGLAQAVLLVLLLVLLLVAPAAPRAQAAPPSPHITVTEITPVVTSSRGTAVVRGRLTNSGSEPLERPRVALVGGPGDLPAAEWSAGDDPASGPTLDSTRLPTVPAGGSTPFVLEVDAPDLLPGRAWGAAPVSVQVEGGDAGVHTFLGIHRSKEYERLRVLWGVPVTLPADRHLVAGIGDRRARAWEEAVGPDSPVAELTEAEPGPGEVWFLDPTLLSAPAAPAGEQSEESGAARSERTTRSDRAAAIEDRLDPDATVVLPTGDADIAAAAGSRSVAELVRPQVTSARTRADELEAHGALAWPADGIVAGERLAAYDDLYGDEQPTLVVPSTSLPDGSSRSAPQRTRSGSRLLVADASLSEAVGHLARPADGLLARQRVVAETAEILGQLPGTSRTVLALPPRSTSPDPATYADLRDDARDIPWLTTTTLGAALDDTKDADPVPLPDTVDEATEQRGDAIEAPPATLSPARAERIADDLAAMRTHASVRSDGDDWTAHLEPTLGQLTSARWRGHPWQWARAEQGLRGAVTLDPQDLTVSSGDVNFFADSGRLQITVVNHTDVELRRLQVRLVPGRPILRVDAQPDPVTIGPGSRQTVTVHATALAAGNVPVDVDVAAPDGEVITTPATLDARVRPTGDWIYWALGGAAALLLAAGGWRTVRRHD